MRRIPLSVQVTLVFLIAFIITAGILTSLLTGELDSLFQEKLYDKLESEAKTLMFADDLSWFDPTGSIGFIRYSSQDRAYSVSDNIEQFMSVESIELLINKAAAQHESIERYQNLVDDELIYYVVYTYNGFINARRNDTMIVLTDQSMKQGMADRTNRQIAIACGLAFGIGYFILWLWIAKLTNNTRSIANALKGMGKEHYRNPIQTKRRDEIGDLVESVEIMRSRILHSEEQKRAIIQGVSHDLKTPVAIIRSYSEALQDEMCSAREVTEITIRECDRLEKKIGQLLDLSRLGYIQSEDDSGRIADMAALIETLVSSYTFQTEAVISTDLQPCVFRGNEDAWRIAIQNILDNAVRYADKRIAIETQDAQVRIFNDGAPIEAHLMSSIFNIYAKGEEGGHGLGMAISSGTADQYGYSISVENHMDGVCFTINKKNDIKYIHNNGSEEEE